MEASLEAEINFISDSYNIIYIHPIYLQACLEANNEPISKSVVECKNDR